jgi:hypothetical protein
VHEGADSDAQFGDGDGGVAGKGAGTTCVVAGDGEEVLFVGVGECVHDAVAVWQ